MEKKTRQVLEFLVPWIIAIWLLLLTVAFGELRLQQWRNDAKVRALAKSLYLGTTAKDFDRMNQNTTDPVLNYEEDSE